jgi:hypothetical protein
MTGIDRARILNVIVGIGSGQWLNHLVVQIAATVLIALAGPNRNRRSWLD